MCPFTFLCRGRQIPNLSNGLDARVLSHIDKDMVQILGNYRPLSSHTQDHDDGDEVEEYSCMFYGMIGIFVLVLNRLFFVLIWLLFSFAEGMPNISLDNRRYV